MQEYEQEEALYTEPQSRTVSASKGLNKIIAVAIILAVAAFSDVMYIVLMSSKFPTGLLLTVCYIGAFTSFGAIGYLLLGKTLSFTPGPQMLASWIVFIGELLINALNIILVFQPNQGGILSMWQELSPATPVFHMVGVAIIFFLDEDLREKHKDMEMQSQVRQSRRQYKLMLHRAKMRVMVKQLQYMETSLLQATQSSQSHNFIMNAGQAMNAELLEQMTGLHYASNSLPNSQTIEALPPAPQQQALQRQTARPSQPPEEKKGFFSLVKDFIQGEGAEKQTEPPQTEETKTVRVTRAVVEMDARRRQHERSQTEKRRRERVKRLHNRPTQQTPEIITEQLPPAEPERKARKKKVKAEQVEG